MDQNKETGGENHSGVPMYIVEAVTAFILLVVGIVVVYTAIALGNSWTPEGPGAGYFPFYVGLMITLSGAVTLFQSLFGSLKNREIFVDGEQFKRIMAVLVPAAIYVLGIEFLGIYVASVIYITLFMIFLGNYSPVKSVIVSLAVIVLFFFMFEVWFKVPLYKGQLDLLRFLGY